MSDPSQLWVECVQWLIRCQILDQSHRVTNKHAEIVDFAQTLRDGVLLCQLVSRLCKESIDMREVSLRPQLSQFLCLKNIGLFLEACQKHFGLKPLDLFDSGELYKVSDFGKVLKTLSKLSKTPKATQNGITGFPSNIRNSLNDHEYYNQEIYKTLAETAESRELEEEVYDSVNEDAKIYDHIITRGIKREQEFQPKDKREHCIKEMLDTEKNYVEALNMLQQKFSNPLKEVLSPDDHMIIFMNLEDILQIHTAFQSDLCHAVRVSLTESLSSTTTTSNQRIGDVFVRWKSKFVCYSLYCRKLPQATARIDQLSSDNSSIRQKVLECQIDANSNKFRLQDVLSVPVQRVLKYHLLLKELVKHTPENHDDRVSAQMGLESMLDLSLYINEVKRDCETRQIIRDIQGSIIDLTMPLNTELCDYGRLLRDGELRVACHSDNDRKGKNRYVFVFDKVLLICKALRASQYSYKNFLLLDEFRVDDVDNNNRASQTLLSRGWIFSWNLIKQNDETVFNFYTKSKENKEKWLLALKTAKENVTPPSTVTSDHLFQFCTFEDATACVHCNKLLRGLFFQGYRCTRQFASGTKCETCVHKECIPYATPCGSVKRVSSARGRRYVAIKEFNGLQGGPRYLSFKENDIIEIISEQQAWPSGWWEGRIVEGEFVGQVGLFPRDYVRENVISRRSSRFREQRPISRQENNVVYRNLVDLQSYPWYVGLMTREQAQEFLIGLASGTFLVRFSGNTGTYAISISYHGMDQEVKHIKIECNPQGQYYLDHGRYFESIVQLVNYFTENSLKESFVTLDSTLKIPLRTLIVGFARAMHAFQSTAPNMISLEADQLIIILSKKDSERGWWKGKASGKIGYFPLAYVQEIEDIFANVGSDLPLLTEMASRNCCRFYVS